ncbi:hypothetical protein CYY_006173 [Polysphondylium violaceum]|uniref:Uncharacterized protein n=1 Tax=Polysphondylium violaceum TaxID=133409 RepID=A0A8J4Q0U7_9MYCE|nr:hypothetical protein CYY_006173 [Polysphondylium violaceum]
MDTSINNIRHISLVDCIVLNFLKKGNVFRRAIVLADVDNDSDNELVLGSLEGNLAIFKGIEKSPWKVANNLGSISCVSVGDLGNNGKNLIVSISSEGICNIFDVSESSQTQLLEQFLVEQQQEHQEQQQDIDDPEVITGDESGVRDTVCSPSSSSSSVSVLDNSNNNSNNNDDDISNNTPIGERSISPPPTTTTTTTNTTEHESHSRSSSIPPLPNKTNNVLIPLLTQRLPPNASCILIGDIDGDGLNELVIGTYDHSLYAFSLYKDCVDNNDDGFNIINNNQNNNSNNNNNNKKPFILNIKNKWQLPGQVGSLVLAKEMGEKILIIGLCEGTNYILLNQKGALYKDNSNQEHHGSKGSNSYRTYPFHHNINMSGSMQADMISSPSISVVSSNSNINNDNSNNNNGQSIQNSGMFSPMMNDSQSVVSVNSSNGGVNSNIINNNNGHNLNNSIGTSIFSIGQTSSRRKRTEIITNISPPIRICEDDQEDGDSNNSSNASSIVSIATLDGVLRLQKIGKGPVWKMEIQEMGSGQLIALQTIRQKNMKTDCAVACGWDGLTLVVDPHRNVLSFKFGDRVCAFTSGYYSLSKGVPSICFIYVTFFGEIIIYHDISLNTQPMRSLTYTTKQEWNQLSQMIPSSISSMEDKEIDQSNSYNLLLSNPEFSIQSLTNYLNQLKSK